MDFSTLKLKLKLKLKLASSNGRRKKKKKKQRTISECAYEKRTSLLSKPRLGFYPRVIL